jgi:hypothetical protein
VALQPAVRSISKVLAWNPVDLAEGCFALATRCFSSPPKFTSSADLWCSRSWKLDKICSFKMLSNPVRYPHSSLWWSSSTNKAKRSRTFIFGIMPLLIRLLYIVSKARVSRNNARCCLVYWGRNRIDRVPARKPANIDVLPKSSHFLRHKQIIALNIDERLPRNIAKDALSCEKVRPNSDLGFFQIFFQSEDDRDAHFDNVTHCKWITKRLTDRLQAAMFMPAILGRLWLDVEELKDFVKR